MKEYPMDPKRLAIRNAIRRPAQKYSYDESQDKLMVIEELTSYVDRLLGSRAINGYLLDELAKAITELSKKSNQLPT